MSNDVQIRALHEELEVLLANKPMMFGPRETDGRTNDVTYRAYTRAIESLQGKIEALRLAESHRFVRVRVAVMVDADGHWAASGGSDQDDADEVEALTYELDYTDVKRVSWITAFVPKAEVAELPAELELASEEPSHG